MKIDLLTGQDLWFTADTHYSHTNICRGVSRWGHEDEGNFVVAVDATRDFPDVPTMNDAMVERINSKVKEDDWLIHMGDWSFGGQNKVFEFRKRINCRNIIITLGNHDKFIKKNKKGEQDLFKLVTKYEEDLIVNGEHRFVLFHYPLRTWNDMRDGTMMLHGHVHSKGDKKFGSGKTLDVGACGNDLYPYHYTEVIELLKDRNLKFKEN